MAPDHRASADELRARITRGERDPRAVRMALLAVPPSDRDAWVDALLDLGPIPDDGPALPRGGVPYLPCAVGALVRVIDEAAIDASDVVVDVGAGVGRAASLMHLLTGASVVGVEVQPALADAARALVARLGLARVAIVEGDAAEQRAAMAAGTVFFLYCPFGGERLRRVLEGIGAIARDRAVRVACVDRPIERCPWLVRGPEIDGVAIHHAAPMGRAIDG